MYANYIKRTFDTVAAIVLLVLASIPFLIIALVIRSDGGPAFFRQQRTGRGGVPFTLYKFRSMVAHNDATDSSTEDQPTKFGPLLRSLSLDELPQLINIVKGDMSFVGPRPWMVEYHKAMNNQQRRRTNVRPGITGLAQAHGRNSLTIHEKIAYDLEYVEKISFITDIRVVLLTIKALFAKKSNAVNLGKYGIHEELAELDRFNNSTAEGY